MGDLDFSKAYARLQVENDFLCERGFDVSKWECEGKCQYFYMGGMSGRLQCCLKREIRDWTLYRIEVEHE